MHLRILLSYHYYKNTDLDLLFKKYFTEPYPVVFVDSGGFSAMTQGVNIDINEYAKWIKRNKHHINTYANLDNIRNAEETKDNQKKLEDLGLEPIPVFHTGEDWDVLEDYVTNYQYIAIGGMVPYMRYTKKIMPFIIKAFKIAKDRAVFHGFGATSWEVMHSFPWYSVDSSSWGSRFRYGQVPLFDSKKGKFYTVSLGNKNNCGRYAYLIRELGFDPADFWDRSRNDRSKICAISAISYIKAEQWLRNRWGEVYIPNNKHVNEGLRLHIADSNATNLGSADEGLKLFLSDAQHELGDIRRAVSTWKQDLV